MECLNNLLINAILDVVNQIKSQISSAVVHLSLGLAGIRTPDLDRHNKLVYFPSPNDMKQIVVSIPSAALCIIVTHAINFKTHRKM
jgi:hypothetical protein